MSRPLRTGFAFGLLALFALAPACSRGSRDSSAELALARLNEARSLHGDAQSRVLQGDIDGAVAQLDKVARLAFPQDAPEREDVAIDALAEAARILVQAKRATEAEPLARRAVAMATHNSYFLGLAYLRLGDTLRAQGRKGEAAVAFEDSIEVNRAVMQGKRERKK